jgi:hypothetical protein
MAGHVNQYADSLRVTSLRQIISLMKQSNFVTHPLQDTHVIS